MPLSENEKLRFKEIIKRQATYFIMSNEPEYLLAITRLKELGITEEEIKKLNTVKQKQLEREKISTPKRRA